MRLSAGLSTRQQSDAPLDVSLVCSEWNVGMPKEWSYKGVLKIHWQPNDLNALHV